MATMTYLGHGSLRFCSQDGHVVYVDPYGGDDYGLPADLILVTHQHGDHNQIQKVSQKPGCRILTEADALEGGVYRQFDWAWIQIESVPAANKNHDPQKCVGYVLALDGVKVYCAGDTSTTDAMSAMAGIDYALLPIDGIYNMDAAEATRCAEAIGAAHAVPIHTDPSGYLDEKVKNFTPKNKLVVRPGETITL